MINQTAFSPASGPSSRAARSFWLCGAAVMLFALAAVSVTAEPAQATAVPVAEDADLSPEALLERLVQTRTQLIDVRREAFQRRQGIESSDEAARALIADMNELRRQMREKNTQLEALVAADEIWAGLHRQELELRQELRELTGRTEGDAGGPDGQEPEDDL